MAGRGVLVSAPRLFLVGVSRGRSVVVDVLCSGGRVRAYLLAGILTLFSGFAVAAGESYWSYSAGSGFGVVRGPTEYDVCNQARLAWWPSDPASSMEVGIGGCSIGGSSFKWFSQGTCSATQSFLPGQPGPNGLTTYACVEIPQCPSGEEWEPLDNKCVNTAEKRCKQRVLGDSWSGGVGLQAPIGSSSTCFDGCEVELGGASFQPDGDTNTYFSKHRYTGQTCGVNTPSEQPPQLPNCVMINGQNVCLSAIKTNCGEINGVEVCTNSAPDGSCTFIPGGSYICAKNAPNDVTHKPIKSDGKEIPPDVVANPDPQAPSAQAGKGADYWSASSMSQAVNGTDAGNGKKVGDCVGSNCGSGGKGEDTGTDAQFAEWGDGCDLDCGMSQLWGELNEIPLIQAFSNLGASLPNDSQCPKPVFEVFGTQIEMKTHCDLYDQVAPILSACFRFMWAFLAVVIVLKA